MEEGANRLRTPSPSPARRRAGEGSLGSSRTLTLCRGERGLIGRFRCHRPAHVVPGDCWRVLIEKAGGGALVVRAIQRRNFLGADRHHHRAPIRELAASRTLVSRFGSQEKVRVII